MAWTLSEKLSGQNRLDRQVEISIDIFALDFDNIIRLPSYRRGCHSHSVAGDCRWSDHPFGNGKDRQRVKCNFSAFMEGWFHKGEIILPMYSLPISNGGKSAYFSCFSNLMVLLAWVFKIDQISVFGADQRKSSLTILFTVRSLVVQLLIGSCQYTLRQSMELARPTRRLSYIDGILVGLLRSHLVLRWLTR